MAGDYTRFRYNPLKDTTGVLMQQGRVLLDQDWNEYIQLQDRRWRAESMDIMGRAVVPIDTPTAFQILIAGTNLTIGRGRMYVDGLLAENHGTGPIEYDPILGEIRGTLSIPYDQQPYFPNPPALPADNNPHLVYLDVWERELTYLEEPILIDKAVAVDTATQLQTVWQVKVLADTPAGTDCSTPPNTVSSWVAATFPSAGRLTTAAAGVPSSTDPCIVPANGGYRGSGNRCYRIEIHTGGPMGTAQFKWSRDNASIATAVTGINAALDTLTVVLTKRDSVLRFQPNDWVEVTDDFRYFHGLPGEMRQVSVVDDVNLTIQLKTPLPAGEFDATKPARHTRVVRWNQSGIVRDPIGNVIVDVDTNGGLIPVPAAGTTIVLEDGIQITFSIDGAMPVGSFRPLDYWMFAARVVDASVEILTQAPPRGILHHYAWLGFVTFPSKVTDCRVFWPPDMGESCDCSVCVSAASHNSGAFTLQAAINKVQGKGGGKVCLGPGIYNIADAVMVSGANAIEISGHGLPNLVAERLLPPKPIMQIEKSVDITVEDIAFLGPVADPNHPPIPGVVLIDSLFVRIKRCLFASFMPTAAGAAPGPGGAQAALLPAIGVAGLVLNAAIHDNFFNNVRVGIGTASATSPQPPFFAFSSIHNNDMVCSDAAVAFSDPKFAASLLEVSLADNFVSSVAGFELRGFGLDVFIERNSFVVNANPAGAAPSPANAAIVCSASQARISNNQIAGARDPGQDGIVLDWPSIYGTQIVGNHIDGLSGDGILIKTRTKLLETIIAQNQLLNLGGSGIKMEAGGFAIDLHITDNSLASVALTGTNDAALVAIWLLAVAFNVKVNENVIEVVGPNANVNASRAGIRMNAGADVRIAGNRIVDIGPVGAVNLSAGVFLPATIGRLDLVNNEVRRASVPPANNSNPSLWSALLLGYVVGDVNARGNLLDSFGSIPTALLLFARSCIFSDNQCFLDNSATAALPTVVVELFAANIITSGNFVQVPVANTTGGAPPTVVILKPADIAKNMTVLGNITSGLIQAGAGPLTAPWLPLNAVNV